MAKILGYIPIQLKEYFNSNGFCSMSKSMNINNLERSTYLLYMKNVGEKGDGSLDLISAQLVRIMLCPFKISYF